MYNYVYKITCPTTGHYYIGKRSSRLPFEHDNDYFGSGDWAVSAVRRNLFLVKELIADFDSPSAAYKAEAALIKASKNDRLNKNYRVKKFIPENWIKFDIILIEKQRKLLHRRAERNFRTINNEMLYYVSQVVSEAVG